MALMSKNQRAGKRGGQLPFFTPDADCLRKHNYATGAGWRTKKKIKGRLGWDVRRKHNGGRATYNHIT